MVKSFVSNIGLKRISKSTDPTVAGYTRDIRDQMKGLQDNLSAFINGLKGVTPEILIDALSPTFAKSVMYCPEKTGLLRSSGYLESGVNGDNVTVEMGYARGGEPYYAVVVHENTAAAHESPTRSKFLQAALEEDADVIPERIIAGYRASMQ